jgi:hypothetical protein
MPALAIKIAAVALILAFMFLHIRSVEGAEKSQTIATAIKLALFPTNKYAAGRFIGEASAKTNALEGTRSREKKGRAADKKLRGRWAAVAYAVRLIRFA